MVQFISLCYVICMTLKMQGRKDIPQVIRYHQQGKKRTVFNGKFGLNSSDQNIYHVYAED